MLLPEYGVRSLAEVLPASDLIVVSAGSSVGARDETAGAVAAVGDPGTVGGTDAPRVRWETRFDTDLGGDTLFLAEVVGELEGELGIRLPDESLHGVRTAGDLVERVREQLAAEQLGAL